jgi:hypothetical protein
MGYVAGHSHLGKSEMVSADLGDVEWKQNTRRGKVGLTTARPNGIGERRRVGLELRLVLIGGVIRRGKRLKG